MTLRNLQKQPSQAAAFLELTSSFDPAENVHCSG